jgi:hypothetical protein
VKIGGFADARRGEWESSTHKKSATKSCAPQPVYSECHYACGSSLTISVPLVASVISCRCQY